MGMPVFEMKNEEYLTPQEVAAILRISVDSVYRMFINVPGVMVLGNMRHSRRPYRTMRIPRSSLRYFENKGKG
jgi:hypothetical protein